MNNLTLKKLMKSAPMHLKIGCGFPILDNYCLRDRITTIGAVGNSGGRYWWDSKGFVDFDELADLSFAFSFSSQWNIETEKITYLQFEIRQKINERDGIYHSRNRSFQVNVEAYPSLVPVCVDHFSIPQAIMFAIEWNNRGECNEIRKIGTILKAFSSDELYQRFLKLESAAGQAPHSIIPPFTVIEGNHEIQN